MESWRKKNNKKSTVSIGEEGIEKALLKGKEDYEYRQLCLETSVFSHIIAGILAGPHAEIPTGQVSKKWLFEILETRVYKTMFNKGVAQCATDEHPSQYMIDLYKEFKEWKEKGGAKKKHATTKVFDNRYELGEFEKEPWMKNIED